MERIACSKVRRMEKKMKTKMKRKKRKRRRRKTEREKEKEAEKKKKTKNRETRKTHLVSNLYTVLITIILAVSNRTLEAARLNKSPAASHDDLIEGRLDTSRACGLRTSPLESLGNGNLYYIVGGNEVDDDQFWPWSTAIYELDPLNGSKEFICSGSLISDRFVLTAAHCIHQSRFDILQADEVFLKIATLRLDDESTHFHSVERIFLHPNYTVGRKANDIALLRLSKGQKLPRQASPICLPSQVANRMDFTDQQVTIIGWGQTSAQSGKEPTRLVEEPNELTDLLGRRRTHVNETLLEAEVRITSTDQCNRNYSRLDIDWLNIDEHFICAKDPDGKRDACQGDSGGPLMWSRQQQQQRASKHQDPAELQAWSYSREPQQSHRGGAEKWYQLGLVSFGHGCANSQFPGVYTRISYYMPWILRTVQMDG